MDHSMVTAPISSIAVLRRAKQHATTVTSSNIRTIGSFVVKNVDAANTMIRLATTAK